MIITNDGAPGPTAGGWAGRPQRLRSGTGTAGSSFALRCPAYHAYACRPSNPIPALTAFSPIPYPSVSFLPVSLQAVYEEEVDSDDDPLEVPTPSRAMSGWVAARVIAGKAHPHQHPWLQTRVVPIVHWFPRRGVGFDPIPDSIVRTPRPRPVDAHSAESGSYRVSTESQPLGGTFAFPNRGISSGPAYAGPAATPYYGISRQRSDSSVGYGFGYPGAPAAPGALASPGLSPHHGPSSSSAAAAGAPSTAAASGNVVLKPASSVIAAPGGMGLTFGWPRGAGMAVGMGPVRLELTLAERMAALSARREERDSRFLMMRRYYVQSLKNYHLETKEMNISLEQLREEVTHARQKVSPDRPFAFATDAEEWLAVDRMVAASSAVWQQNKELRARLAAATWRHSGNADGEPLNATAAAAEARDSEVLPLGVKGADGKTTVIAGGTKPSKKRRGSASGAAAGGAGAGSGASTGGTPADKKSRSRTNDGAGFDGEGDDGDMEIEEEDSDDEDNPYSVRTRSSPRRSARDIRYTGRDTVLAIGDLVLTPYGRGVVITQRDQPLLTLPNPDAVVEVVLQWGARAYLGSTQVTLLAVAGEEYTAPTASDWHWQFAASAPAPPVPASLASAAAAATAASIKPEPAAAAAPAPAPAPAKAAHGSKRARTDAAAAAQAEPAAAASTQAASSDGRFDQVRMSSAASTSWTASSSAPAANVQWKHAAAAGSSIIDGSGGSTGIGRHHGTSSAEVDSEQAEDRSAAVRTTRKVKTKSGKPITNRTPVFRTSWQRNGVPHGVPLKIDPVRGTTALGFVYSTADGSHVFERQHIQHGPGGAGAASSRVDGTHAGAGGDHGHDGMMLDHGASPVHTLSSRHSDVTSRALRAERERLEAQLRATEEIRLDQRKRLTDMRHQLFRLLENLNEERARTTQLTSDLHKMEKDRDEVSSHLQTLAQKYEPESAAAAGDAPGMTGAGAESEESEESEGDLELNEGMDADTVRMTRKAVAAANAAAEAKLAEAQAAQEAAAIYDKHMAAAGVMSPKGSSGAASVSDREGAAAGSSARGAASASSSASRKASQSSLNRSAWRSGVDEEESDEEEEDRTGRAAAAAAAAAEGGEGAGAAGDAAANDDTLPDDEDDDSTVLEPYDSDAARRDADSSSDEDEGEGEEVVEDAEDILSHMGQGAAAAEARANAPGGLLVEDIDAPPPGMAEAAAAAAGRRSASRRSSGAAGARGAGKRRRGDGDDGGEEADGGAGGIANLLEDNSDEGGAQEAAGPASSSAGAAGGADDDNLMNSLTGMASAGRSGASAGRTSAGRSSLSGLLGRAFAGSDESGGSSSLSPAAGSADFYVHTTATGQQIEIPTRLGPKLASLAGKDVNVYFSVMRQDGTQWRAKWGRQVSGGTPTEYAVPVPSLTMPSQ